jgi:hypothetical protein
MAMATVYSTLGTVNVAESVNYVWQRKLLFAEGLIWAFYADTVIKYRTSADGVTWSDPIAVNGSAPRGHRFALAYDNGYVHYVYSEPDSGGLSLYYRRGLLNDDGTITWSAAQQTVYTHEADQMTQYNTIIVDSNHYPWIGITQTKYDRQAPFYAKVFKSSSNDGTWTTQGGFPITFITNNTFYPVPIGVPLTAGKTFWTYSRDSLGTILGREWNGSSWESEEECGTKNSRSSVWNLVSENDDVHMAAWEVTVDGVTEIFYNKRDYTTGWGTETTIQSGENACHIAITLTGTNSVVVYWQDNPTTDHIYYREINDEVLGDVVDWVDETSEDLATNLGPNAFINSNDAFKSGVIYTTKTALPFNLKFIGVDTDVVTYSISGTVTLSEEGVADATIRVVDQVTGTVYTTTSEAGGTYEITELPAGTYHAVVEYEYDGVKYNAKSLWDITLGGD